MATGGRASRQKGDRHERNLVRLLQIAGIAAERTPLSGAARGRFGGYDLSVPLLSRDMRVEAKHHARAFQRLYRWLDNVDFLIVKADRSEPLVVVPLRLAIEIAKATERGQDEPTDSGHRDTVNSRPDRRGSVPVRDAPKDRGTVPRLLRERRADPALASGRSNPQGVQKRRT